MISSRLLALRAAAASVAALGIAVSGQQPTPSAIYTTQQANAGRSAYQANCASCHRPDLGGSNEAPQLAGANFMTAWRDRTTRDLLSFMTTTMPPDNPGSAGNQAYTDIVAYVLQANGAPARSQALTPATAVTIGSVATRQGSPAPAAQSAGQKPPPPAQGGGDQENATPTPAGWTR